MYSTYGRIALLMTICFSGGCSSLGISFWPSQLPLLNKAKQFASQSRLPSGLNHELSKDVLTDYYLEPGDRVLIDPLDLNADLRIPSDQQVQIDGSIDLARFGRIRVAGMTVEQVENAILTRISEVDDKAEYVNVQLVETNAAKIYVLGAVGSPGSYPLEGSETVLDAIVNAGGLTSKASPCDIIFVRPTSDCECRVVQRICYRQITQLGDVTTNYHLQPGDRIVVGERTLMEELSIWKQATPCRCCDRSQCVEKSPPSEHYRNRFSSWTAPFALPAISDDDVTGEDFDTSGTNDTPRDTKTYPGDDARSKANPESLPAPSNDEDFFLPPIRESLPNSSRGQ